MRGAGAKVPVNRAGVWKKSRQLDFLGARGFVCSGVWSLTPGTITALPEDGLES